MYRKLSFALVLFLSFSLVGLEIRAETPPVAGADRQDTHQELVSLGRYTMKIESYTVGNTHFIEASYQPYDLVEMTMFEFARYKPMDPPLGPRPNWWNYRKKIPSNMAHLAELNTKKEFFIRLSDNTIESWATMMEFMDLVPQAYLIKNHIMPYMEKNRDNLKALYKKRKAEIEALGPNQLTRLQEREWQLFGNMMRMPDMIPSFLEPAPWINDPTIPTPVRMTKTNIIPQPIQNSPLIVVHASRTFDSKETARAGIDRVVEAWKKRNQTVVYLVEPNPTDDSVWYPKDRQPDFAVDSAGGEHNLPLSANEVTLIGGYFGDYNEAHGCHFKALADTITRHFLQNETPLTVHLPFPAIYFYRDDQSYRDEVIASIRSDADAMAYMIESLLFTEDTAYLGMSSYYTGEISTRDYTFHFLLNGKEITKLGTGARQVYLSFYRTLEDFPLIR